MQGKWWSVDRGCGWIEAGLGGYICGLLWRMGDVVHRRGLKIQNLVSLGDEVECDFVHLWHIFRQIVYCLLLFGIYLHW